MKSKVLPAMAAFLIGSASFAAHHSFTAEYDLARAVSLKGVVSMVAWSNPHVHIFVAVKDDKGNSTTWDLEGGIPSVMSRRGLSPNLVNVGDAVTVTGYRARDNSNRLSRVEVTAGDGKKHNLGGAGEFQPAR